jgi:hypothetical protein
MARQAAKTNSSRLYSSPQPELTLDMVVANTRIVRPDNPTANHPAFEPIAERTKQVSPAVRRLPQSLDADRQSIGYVCLTIFTWNPSDCSLQRVYSTDQVSSLVLSLATLWLRHALTYRSTGQQAEPSTCPWTLPGHRPSSSDKKSTPV